MHIQSPLQFSSDPSSSKAELRKKIIETRLLLSHEEWSRKSITISKRLKTVLENIPVETLLLFYPIKNEPDILDLSSLISDSRLPKAVQKKSLHFFSWKQGDQLTSSHFGVPEPQSEGALLEIENAITTVVCVPCLALDNSGVRLGYGGGYYDRFLAENDNVWTIGILFSDFFVERLPRLNHDILLKSMCHENDYKEF